MGLALADIVEVAEDIRQGKLMQAIDSAHTEGESVYLVTHPTALMNYRTQLVLQSVINNLRERGARLCV